MLLADVYAKHEAKELFRAVIAIMHFFATEDTAKHLEKFMTMAYMTWLQGVCIAQSSLLFPLDAE